jgi:hypothetical protein
MGGVQIHCVMGTSLVKSQGLKILTKSCCWLPHHLPRGRSLGVEDGLKTLLHWDDVSSFSHYPGLRSYYSLLARWATVMFIHLVRSEGIPVLPLVYSSRQERSNRGVRPLPHFKIQTVPSETTKFWPHDLECDQVFQISCEKRPALVAGMWLLNMLSLNTVVTLYVELLSVFKYFKTL